MARCSHRLTPSILAAIFAAIATTLAACGGSSDGGPLPVDFATLTRDNAEQTAGAVLSSLEGNQLGEYTRLLALSSTVTPYGQSFISGKPGGLGSAGTSAARTPIAPTTSPCGVAGNVTLSGDITTTQTLTPGDTIAFDFEGCDDGITVVSGSFALTITSFEGDFIADSFVLGVDASLGAFQVAENGETTGPIDGDASIQLDVTSLPALGLTIDADAISVNDGTSAHALEQYSLALSSDSLTGAYTVLVSGRASNDALDGVVDFATTEGLQSADGGNPFTGRIEVYGERASMTIIVLDSTALRIEVDEDDDGTVDAILDTTWDALT